MGPLVGTSSPSGSGSHDLIGKLGGIPLEEVACYLCGETAGKILVDDPPFRVRLCAGCGLGYTSPRLVGNRIHEIYGEEYWQSDSARDYGYTSYEADVSGYLRTFARRAEFIQRHVPTGRVLEIGCAAGFFLKVMQDRDYEVHGLEISQEIAETARKRFDLDDVRSCHIKDAGFEAGSFDLVVLWDVIEHMADPITELRLCRDLLAEGGALIVQTQDVSSLARKLMGRRWHHFKQLEHIYHFDPSTIAELLDRSGLRIEKITRRRAGKYVSFEFIRERLKRFGRIADLMGRPLKLLGRRFLYVNPFDEMIVVARLKPPREDAQA